MTASNTRNLAIQNAQIVRSDKTTYTVSGFALVEKTHESISAAKKYVRESGLRCVANMPNEKPNVLVKVKAHLGQLKARHDREEAAKKAAEEKEAKEKALQEAKSN